MFSISPFLISRVLFGFFALLFRGFCLFTGIFQVFYLRIKTCGDLYGVAPGTHHTYIPIPVQYVNIIAYFHMLTLCLSLHAINSYPVDFILSTSRESRELTVLVYLLHPTRTIVQDLYSWLSLTTLSTQGFRTQGFPSQGASRKV